VVARPRRKPIIGMFHVERRRAGQGGGVKIRRHVHYSGRVQGVGFRYTATGVARGWAVTGYVRNLGDGRVELVAEGEKPEISGFLAELAEEMDRHITDVQTADKPYTGEFSTFCVVF
jgi:acylphosphatase